MKRSILSLREELTSKVEATRKGIPAVMEVIREHYGAACALHRFGRRRMDLK
jgi:hypothetical protein